MPSVVSLTIVKYHVNSLRSIVFEHSFLFCMTPFLVFGRYLPVVFFSFCSFRNGDELNTFWLK